MTFWQKVLFWSRIFLGMPVAFMCVLAEKLMLWVLPVHVISSSQLIATLFGFFVYVNSRQVGGPFTDVDQAEACLRFHQNSAVMVARDVQADVERRLSEGDENLREAK